MWTLLLDKLFGGVTDYFKNIQKLKEVKLDAEIKRVQTQSEQDNNIDLITLRDRGIKDDLITYTLLAIIVITVFNPLMSVYFDYDPLIISDNLAIGFDNLAKLPEYIWWGMLIVMADVFGLRSLLRELFGVLVMRLQKSLK